MPFVCFVLCELFLAAMGSAMTRKWMSNIFAAASGVLVLGVVLGTSQSRTDPNVSSGTTTVGKTLPGVRNAADTSAAAASEPKSPPPPPPGVMNGPASTASSGPTETGPHGQSDVTKPMPAVPKASDRIEPDRPVAPEGEPKKR